MTHESLAPFQRNRRRLPRKQRPHERSSKANRQLVKRNPPSFSGGTDHRISLSNTSTRNGKWSFVLTKLVKAELMKAKRRFIESDGGYDEVLMVQTTNFHRFPVRPNCDSLSANFSHEMQPLGKSFKPSCSSCIHWQTGRLFVVRPVHDTVEDELDAASEFPSDLWSKLCSHSGWVPDPNCPSPRKCLQPGLESEWSVQTAPIRSPSIPRADWSISANHGSLLKGQRQSHREKLSNHLSPAHECLG
ncbi:unnamed protein product [Protopolystoma xenopodis]|uniref:Uncharacterized protein n=1 Tax=Protopolystoma xenopodis TaxID=117903 RepID=A0A3S5AIS9_9PLAT|nr:unnamed protein product [Protopolystoma xenopodis]